MVYVKIFVTVNCGVGRDGYKHSEAIYITIQDSPWAKAHEVLAFNSKIYIKVWSHQGIFILWLVYGQKLFTALDC